MLVNSSAINATTLSLYLQCIFSRESFFAFTAFNITNIVLHLPLSVFILFHGLQQRRQKPSTVSHANSFTYHMAIMELIRLGGCSLFCWAIYETNLNILAVAFCLFPLIWFGEMCFHILTCVERYLAVVHPITYLSLRKERGVRIRNISIGCVWLLGFAMIALVKTVDVFIIVAFCLLISSLTIISLCSLSVLWVLIRSGPADQIGRRKRVDQSKLRAFYTIVTILGVLIFKLIWAMIWVVLFSWGGRTNCIMTIADCWVNFPSSLVLPLLFVSRTGKCCKKNTK